MESHTAGSLGKRYTVGASKASKVHSSEIRFVLPRGTSSWWSSTAPTAPFSASWTLPRISSVWQGLAPNPPRCRRWRWRRGVSRSWSASAPEDDRLAALHYIGISVGPALSFPTYQVPRLLPDRQRITFYNVGRQTALPRSVDR